MPFPWQWEGNVRGSVRQLCDAGLGREDHAVDVGYTATCSQDLEPTTWRFVVGSPPPPAPVNPLSRVSPQLQNPCQPPPPFHFHSNSLVSLSLSRGPVQSHAHTHALMTVSTMSKLQQTVSTDHRLRCAPTTPVPPVSHVCRRRGAPCIHPRCQELLPSACASCSEKFCHVCSHTTYKFGGAMARATLGLATTTWVPMGARLIILSPFDHPEPSQRRQKILGKM